MKLIALSDVTSPLTGAQGAAHVFGAQKGFTDLAQVDAALARFAAMAATAFTEHHDDQHDDQHGDLARRPGAGAAGGLGFGLTLLGATLRDGAEFILDTSGLAADIAGYDWVVTGEGRSDAQTILGKGPAAVAALARRHQVPVSLLSGAVDACAELDTAFDGCFSIVAGPAALADAMAGAGPLLEQAAARLARLFTAAHRGGGRTGDHN
jgi:glycerate kinase